MAATRLSNEQQQEDKQPSLAFHDFFPSTDTATFFDSIYQHDTFVDSQPHGNAPQLLSPTMRDVVAPLADPHALCQHHFSLDEEQRKPKSKHTAPFQIKEQGETRQVSSCKQMEDELAAGAGLLIRYEDLVDSPAQDHVKQLQDGVRDVFGTESTVHLYHATQNESRALMPHTDPYDVLVIQLHGSKRWTTCIPDAYVSDTDTNNDGSGTNAEDDDNTNTGTGDHGASASASASASSSFPSHHGTRARPSEAETIKHFNPAQLGQLQEIRRQKQEGCTRYEDRDLRGMRCTEFTLRAGDTMYMPKGIIHFALSGEEGSSHLTISLERKGLAWADALMHAALSGSDIVDTRRSLVTGENTVQSLLQQHGDGSAAGGERDEVKAFVASFQSLCREVGPDVLETYTKANDLDAFLNADGIGALVERVCSEESATAVVEQLCARGKMPVDVTSPRFRKMRVPQMARTRRNTVTTSYNCTSGCDENCNRFTCQCDEGCTTTCNEGCTDCNESCDGQQCDSSCDSSCDGETYVCRAIDSLCNTGCDASCDSTQCYGSCDICIGCTSGCDDSCDKSCDASCDLVVFSCDSGCDQSCDSGCDDNCNNCYAGCDSNCIPTDCDADCDGTCACDTSCDGPCNSGCSTTCNTGCDGCPDLSSCTGSCDEGCSCNPGFAGSGQACEACPTGTYASSSGQSTCTPCSSCPSGQYRVNCGGSSAGTCGACHACPPGEQRVGCEGTNAGTCAACPSGTYKSTQGNGACSSCPACDPGFTRVECQGTSAGHCVGTTCDVPPSSSNTAVSVSNDGIYPSTATYTCSAGYELQGSNTLTCSVSGDWEGDVPQCVGVECDGIHVDNGIVTPSGTINYPKVAAFSCSTGYVLMGATSAQCQADGTWSSPAPTCVGRLCTLLDTPNHGSVSYTNNRQYPSTATYTCQAGYELSDTGDAQRSCIASSGGFGGTAPSCVGVLCNPLGDPQNGHLRLSSTPARYPATAEFSCVPGYELVGQAQLSCKTDKTWSAPAPTCRGVLCTAPSIDHAQVSATSGRYPADASVTCAPGYGLVGASTLSCRTDGTWGELPSCQLCPANSYAPSPTQPCASCPSGTSTNGQTGATKCECIAGHEPSGDGSTCVPCQANHFKPDFGSVSCQQCQSGFQTENGDFTRCVGVPCDPVRDIENGDPENTMMHRYPATVSYECDTGFQLVGDVSSITCQTDGTWSALPSCTYICGDDLVVDGEECDDGGHNKTVGCSSTCQLERLHSCVDGSTAACVYCNFTSRPERLVLACDDPMLDTKVQTWADATGNAEVLDHEHCGDPSLSYVAGKPRGTVPGCYHKVYAFTAVFDGGQVMETVAGVVRVYDDTKPTFQDPPSSTTADCHSVPAFADVSASDTCMTSSPAVSKQEVRTDGACPYAYTLTRTWTTQDACGNENAATQVVTVQDVTKPTFTTRPTDRVLECSADVDADIEALRMKHVDAAASDLCSDTLSFETVETARDLSGCGSTGQVSLKVTVTDECGNPQEETVTVDVVDKTAPVPVNVPADVTVECSAIPPIADDVHARDACGLRRVNATASEERQDGPCPHSYDLLRTFTFVDACDNPVSRTQRVTVQDTTGPVITRDADDLELECSAERNDATIAAWLAVNGGAQAMDACSGVHTLTWTHDYDPQYYEVFPGGCSVGTGQVLVTFTVADECGRTSTVNGSIKIVDTREPAFVAPLPPLTGACDAVPQATVPQAYDNCTGEVTPTQTTTRMDGDCPHQYHLIHSWVAEDECGWTTTTQQTVTVTDAAAPTITKQSADRTVECSVADNEAQLDAFLAEHGGAQATEVCGGVTWLYSDVDTVLDVAQGASGDVVKQDGCGTTFAATAHFYAVDECSNAAKTTATFTVQDTLAPVLDTPPAASIDASCDAVPALRNISATDMCAGALVAVASEERLDGRCTHTYTLSRTWMVQDPCGHMTTKSQLVHVDDSAEPVITKEAEDLVVECNAETDSVIAAWLEAHGNAAAADACDRELTWQHDFESVKYLLQYGCGSNAVNVTFTVMDDCGNAAETQARVVVQDTTAPFFTQLPSDDRAECDPTTNQNTLDVFLAAYGGARASDVCGGVVGQDVAWSYAVDLQTVCGNAYDSVVTFTATDHCGNNVSATATMAFEDTQKPVIKLRGADPQLAQVGFPWLDPSVDLAADRCHQELTPFVEVVNPPNTTQVGNVTVFYRVEDACGYVGLVNRTVYIRDTLPPTLEVLGAKRMYVSAGSLFLDPGAAATDAYSRGTDIVTHAFDGGVDIGSVRNAALDGNRTSFTIVYRAADLSGNTVLRYGRHVRVLPPPSPLLPATAQVSLHFSRSIVLSAEAGDDAPSSGEPTPSEGSPAFTYTRLVTPVADADSGSVTLSVFEAEGLSTLLGGEVHGVQVEDPSTTLKEVAVVLGPVSPDVVASARASDAIEAMSTPVRVRSFHGSVRTASGQCSGKSGVEDSLARVGRRLVSAQCDGCLCIFTTNDPARTLTSSVAFDAMALEQTVQHLVTVQSSTGSALNLVTLRLRLQQLGVVPVRLVHKNQGQAQVMFVARTPLPSHEDLDQIARVTLVSNQPIVGTRITADIHSDTSNVTILSRLYALGIVPDSMQLVSSENGTSTTLTLTTNNDVTNRAERELADNTGWIHSLLSISYVYPGSIEEPLWPFNYTITGRSNVTQDDVRDAITTTLTHADAVFVIRGCEARVCTVSTNTPLLHTTLQALRGQGAIFEAALTVDVSIESELISSLEENLSLLLPYPANRISVFRSSAGPQHQQQRRKRELTDIAVTVSFTAQEDASLVTAVPEEGYEVPRSRYLLRFRVKNAASSANAREKALVALNALSIAAVDVTAAGDQVTAVTVSYESDDRLDQFRAHANIISSSVLQQVSIDSPLSITDAVAATTDLANSGELYGVVHGRKLVVVSTTSTFNPNPTTTTTTTNPSVTVQPGASTSGGEAWQISVGVIGALLLIVVLVAVILRHRRRQAKRTLANTTVLQHRTVSYENPAYSGSMTTTENPYTMYDDLGTIGDAQSTDYAELPPPSVRNGRLLSNPLYESGPTLSDDGDGYLSVDGTGAESSPSAYEDDVDDGYMVVRGTGLDDGKTDA
ncbi:hypothetical protein PTSG_10194 [Salpingoeca rosetta]|uniref:Uncharacterized protein n=1 Tax=Salpingoeca rosetta (strain ATCC 50818 / BSB-021) TaxID=946362 RepID=F2UQK6_SALR5|nr:uncharacterized protein PTSG_10194 [Salpingoeca rosetta]EGD79911.1 hypothetical protein PTSG_10194 [Salpingoeca rosetta]|eukprot:XP_004988532.1 hypothetical protein PTSG_10194 [Salpingoeca rosetta]